MECLEDAKFVSANTKPNISQNYIESTQMNYYYLLLCCCLPTYRVRLLSVVIIEMFIIIRHTSFTKPQILRRDFVCLVDRISPKSGQSVKLSFNFKFHIPLFSFISDSFYFAKYFTFHT